MPPAELAREEELVAAVAASLDAMVEALVRDDEPAALEAVREAEGLFARAGQVAPATLEKLQQMHADALARAEQRLEELRQELARSTGGARAQRAYGGGAPR